MTGTGTTPTPFGFVGQGGYQTDTDTGLMLCGHRFYDSCTGRFLSRDPIRDGYNWYTYCENDPINATDTTGTTDKGDTPKAGTTHNGSTHIVPIVFDKTIDGKREVIRIDLPPSYATTRRIDVDYIKEGDNDWVHIRPGSTANILNAPGSDDVVVDGPKWPRFYLPLAGAGEQPDDPANKNFPSNMGAKWDKTVIMSVKDALKKGWIEAPK